MAMDCTTSMDDNAPMTTTHVVVVVLKWSKEVIEFEIEIPTTVTAGATTTTEAGGAAVAAVTGRSFKDIVHSLTKVPVDRQKIVVTKSKSKSKSTSSIDNKTNTTIIKWWKGILKDDFDFASAIVASTPPPASNTTSTTERIEMKATLMGTAEVLKSNSNKDKTMFLEDMTPSEKKEAERMEWMDSMANVTAMIPALQVPPPDRQPTRNANDDSGGVDTKDPMSSPPMIVSEFEEVRAYDRLVHGYSQLRIDALLWEQQQQNKPQQPTEKDEPISRSTPRLLGRPVMTMGLELQRAYVNDLAVLEDGTLISGLDDGHVQLWKHCLRVCDIVHKPCGFGGPDAFSGVDSILALDNSNHQDDDTSSPFAFCTAGRGCLRVWDSDGEALLGAVPSPFPLASPTGLVRIPTHKKNVLCLAARFRITRPASRRPRLVPQDEAGRRRVAEIEAGEAEMNATLTRLSKTVQIFFANIGSDRSSDGGGNTRGLQTSFSTASAPVTALASWKQGDDTILAVGDDQGGIMLQKIVTTEPSSRGTSGSSSNASNTNESIVRIRDLRRIQFVSVENASESHSGIVCLKYVAETKQLWVSTKGIPPTSLTSASPTAPRFAARENVASTFISSVVPQAVHSIDIDAILDESLRQSSRPDNALLFSLAGHKDVVQCIVPLPNGDLVTAGGKHDATTQVWSRSQLKKAAAAAAAIATRATTQEDRRDSNLGTAENSDPQLLVPILTKAATVNLCKDAGYVFAVEVLRDFKSTENTRDGTNSSKHRVDSPFAIAIARYNVVKIVI